MIEYTKVHLSADRDGLTGRYQLCIGVEDDSGGGIGHRLEGPKYSGNSNTLVRRDLTEDDAKQIRSYLNKIYPENETGLTPHQLITKIKNIEELSRPGQEMSLSQAIDALCDIWNIAKIAKAEGGAS